MPKDIKEAILKNEGLIYKAANYFNYNKEDLYQAGCIGIINGFKNFDTTKNTKFSSYIYSYILGEMKKLVREDKPLKISRDISRLKSKISEAHDILSQKLMREPSYKELSTFLNIEEKVLTEALNSNIVLNSLDSNLNDSNMMLHEIISDKNISYDELIYLKTEIENLEEPERSIMINRYFEDKTQKETASTIGLSQVDVSRRENKVLSKIKTFN